MGSFFAAKRNKDDAELREAYSSSVIIVIVGSSVLTTLIDEWPWRTGVSDVGWDWSMWGESSH